MLGEIKEIMFFDIKDDIKMISSLDSTKARITAINRELTEIPTFDDSELGGSRQASGLTKPNKPEALTKKFTFFQKWFSRRSEYLETKRLYHEAQEKYESDLKKYEDKKETYKRRRQQLILERATLEEKINQLQGLKDNFERIKQAKSIEELGLSFEKAKDLLKQNGIPIVLGEEDVAIIEEEKDMYSLNSNQMSTIRVDNSYILCPREEMEKNQDENPGVEVIGYEGENADLYRKVLDKLLENKDKDSEDRELRDE